MEWPYSECGGESDIDEDSNQEHSQSFSLHAEQTEVVQLLGQTLELPKGLCAQPEVFWEFFSPEHLWNELPRETREDLVTKFLPQFPDPASDVREKEATIQKLFHRESFRFNSSPLVDLQRNLEEGHYLTDVVKYRAKIAKSERHEQRYQECEYISRVARKLAASRKSLLELVGSSSSHLAGQLTIPRTSTASRKKGGTTSSVLNESVAVKARKRYLAEVASLNAEGNLSLSDSDEEAAYIEHRRHSTTTNHLGISVKIPRKPGRPPMVSAPGELFTETGETKVCSTFSYKSKASSSSSSSSLTSALPLDYKSLFNDEYLRQALRRHRKRKTADLDSTTNPNESSFMNDFLLHDMFSGSAEIMPFPVARAPIAPIARPAAQPVRNAPTTNKKGVSGKARRIAANSKTKTESLAMPRGINSNVNTPLDAPLVTTNRFQLPVVLTKDVHVTKVKPEVSREPVSKKQKIYPPEKLAEGSSGSSIESRIPSDVVDVSADNSLLSLRQQACFMSLVRSIFCSTPDHRTTFDNLQRIVRQWLLINRSKTNDWFNDCHSWSAELPSVVKFLAGEFSEQPDDFVPYIEPKPHLQIYQWIGAGRDTDSHLLPLYRFWLEHRLEFGRSTMPEGRAPKLSKLVATNVSSSSRSSSSNVSGEADDVVSATGDVPLPRSPSTWIMRPEKAEEILSYRAQEKQRYENPSVPFTYRLHGYESVVGPVHGLYAQSLNKGSNLLLADRPPCVTLLTLVRDAVARLPNGEGSKAHISELLKASQYIVPGSNVQVGVNSALERLQGSGEKCVQWDARRKVFVYLHRARTEADFRRGQLVTTSAEKRIRAKEVGDGHDTKKTIPNSRAIATATTISGGRVIGAASLINMDQLVVRGQSQQQNVQTAVVVSSNSPQPRKQFTPVMANNNVFKVRTSKSPVVVNVSVSRESSPSAQQSVQLSSNSRVMTFQSGNATTMTTKADVRDIELSLDKSHPPALIQKVVYNKGTLRVANCAGTSSPGDGATTFHVTTGGHARPLMSLLTTAPAGTTTTTTTTQGQSLLMGNSQRTVKITPAQSVLISQAMNSPTIISPKANSSGQATVYATTTTPTSIGGKTLPRSTPLTVLPGTAVTKVLRTIKPITAQVAGGTLPGTRTILSHHQNATITTSSAEAMKGSVAPKPIQICTSAGNVSVVEKMSPTNGGANANVIRNAAATNLLSAATGKPVIQNILIRSGSPQAQKRSIPLKSFATTMDSASGGGNASPGNVSSTMKSILVTSSAAGDAPNVIKIRTSMPSQLVTTTTNVLQTPRVITTQGGAQILHIAGGTAGQGGQQFILNSVRQGSGLSTQGVTLPSSIAMKGALKQGTQTTGGTQLVQLPAKTTLLKGGSITARVIKAVSSNATQQQSGGNVTATGQQVMRTMSVSGGAAVQKVLTNSGVGQLLTLVDASGNKTTHSTPIRIAKSPGSANVIQLQAAGTASANGASPGTQYTVLSSSGGRSVIQVQQPQQQQHQQGSKVGSVGEAVGNVQQHLQRVNVQSNIVARGKPENVLSQLVNAKMVSAGTSGAGETTVSLKPGIRMVNAANITRIGGGKPVLISNKMTGNVTSLLRASGQQTMVKLPVTSTTASSATATSLVIGGQTVKVPNTLTTTRTVQPGTTTQHVMIGNQLVKIQSANVTGDRGKSVILNSNLGGQAYKIQSLVQNPGKVIKTAMPLVKGATNTNTTIKTSPATANRVVLVQGPGGQLILPSNLQGGSINLKSLKMISVQQQQQQQQQQQSPQPK